MRLTTNTFLSDMICSNCCNVTTFPRHNNKKKARFYKIKEYCYVCDKETNHIELKDISLAERDLETSSDLTEEEEYVYQLIKTNKSRRNR